MKVKQVMTAPVVSVEMDDRLHVVYDIFRNVRFHHLIVLAEKKMVGILSDRDLLKAISPRVGTKLADPHDDATLNKRVHQIMTRDVITIHEEAGVLAAIKLFNRHTISCLPVVNDSGNCVGILSWRDIFRQIEKTYG